MAIDTIVFGTSGMLGSAFNTFGFNSDDFDIRDTDKVERMVAKYKPECIINCAGLSDIDTCEANPMLAAELNYKIPFKLADICNSYGIKLIQFSTMHSSSDNNYCLTKKYMEDYLPKYCHNYAIVRVGWLFSRHNDRKFLSTVLRCVRDNKKVPIYKDEIGSPTYATDVANYVMQNKFNMNGTINIANKGNATRQEWVDEIADILGVNIKTKAIKRTIPMLADSSYAETRILKTWEEALDECLS